LKSGDELIMELGGMAKKKLKWTDSEDIAFELIDKFPSTDPSKLSLPDIQRRVTSLPSFGGSAKVEPETLETIQRVWFEERSDMEDELGPLSDQESDEALDEDDYRDDRMIEDDLGGEDDDEDEDEFSDGFHEDEMDDRE
jgi:FeS assembly protein IscX